ncbi:hypothetical protein BB561_002608 [Smittium simulii]|uniref:Uncharacterized protein n=1 Tax=Smittium simulii TaxID=133385 RepID=A0A2T9YPY2_9FUNG|nr:hypothetical protein BB561_002608 [Smittium simulii]
MSSFEIDVKESHSCTFPLIDNPFKNILSTWITGTKKWISRFGTAGSYGSARKVLEIRARAKDKKIFGMSRARAANLQTVIEACRKLVHAGKYVALTRLRQELRITPVNTRASVLRERAYYNRNLTDLELLYPEHSSGIQKIIKIGIWCFNTALKLAKSKTLAEEYLNKCPFCNKFEPETVEHYLFKCSKWADQRQSILGEHISQPNLIVPGSTCNKLLGTLLGEELKFNYAGIL